MFIFAGDGYIAAIVECFFDDRPDVGFGGELRNPSLKIFALESGDNFERIRGVGLSWSLRAVGKRRIVPMFAPAHTRLSSACARGARCNLASIWALIWSLI